jgi:hypothetical protein
MKNEYGRLYVITITMLSALFYFSLHYIHKIVRVSFIINIINTFKLR